MATRTVSTRVAVTGESEYKAAIKSINEELNSMKTALSMTEGQFQTNATSQEALTAKGQALEKVLETQKAKVQALEDGLRNAQEAESKYAKVKEELTEKIQKNKAALEQLKSETGNTAEKEKALTEENEKLNKELEKNEAYLKSSKSAVNKWTTDLNKAKTEVYNTQAKIEQNSKALSENTSSLNKNSEAVNFLAIQLAASGLKKAISEITEALMACVDASIEFESAMAGVAKTTDLSAGELAGMGQAIKDMATEIPITTTELAGIVESAGQLGIAKDDLLSFAEVMANLGVATNMTSEEAATMLARFANVTKMDPSDYERLGSTIVDLGNNFATTESEITEMGQRMAAAGQLAGLTQPEILGLAAAMTSVGIKADAGGTAMTQTMTAIEKAVANGDEKLQGFAEIAGMSSEAFAAAWKEKPAEAIENFIRGLGNLEEQGESATLKLDELGLSGVRQSNMLKSLASASDLMSDAIDRANSAWNSNTALMKEATTRYETTESKVQMCKNSFNNLKIAIGDQLSPALKELAEKGNDVCQWATEFVQENEWLAPAITAVVTGLTALTAVIAGTIIVTKAIIPLIRSFNAVLSNGTVGIVLTVATALVTLISSLGAFIATLPYAGEEARALNSAMEDCGKTFEDADKTFQDISKNIAASAKVAEKYADRLKQLDKKTKLTADEQREYNRLVEELNRIMPEANLQLNETTGKLEGGAQALDGCIQKWQEMAETAAETARINAMTQGLTDAYIALYSAQDDLTVAMSSATDQMLAYFSAMENLQAAQHELAELQKDGSASAGDLESAQRKVDDAQNEVISSARKLSKEERDSAEDIGLLQKAVDDAQGSLDQYNERIDILTSTMEPVAEASKDTAESLDSVAQSAKEIGSITGEGISEEFAEGVAGMPESAQSAMDSVDTVVTESGEVVKAHVGQMAIDSVTDYDLEIAKIEDSTQTHFNNVITQINNLAPVARAAAFNVGVAIDEGMISGIMSRAAAIAAAAAKVVREAINAANAEAQVNSPSKKMIKLGHSLDEGLVVGIRQMEKDVLDTMKGTMSKVVDVQVEVPEIPDNTMALLNVIKKADSTSNNTRVAEAIEKLAKQKEKPSSVEVTQNIYADSTSYVGQQREAKKNFKQLSRELSR